MPPFGSFVVITLLDKILPLLVMVSLFSMVPLLVMAPLLVMVPSLANVLFALICSVCPDLIVNDDPEGKLKSAVMFIRLLLSGL